MVRDLGESRLNRSRARRDYAVVTMLRKAREVHRAVGGDVGGAGDRPVDVQRQRRGGGVKLALATEPAVATGSCSRSRSSGRCKCSALLECEFASPPCLTHTHRCR